MVSILIDHPTRVQMKHIVNCTLQLCSNIAPNKFKTYYATFQIHISHLVQMWSSYKKTVTKCPLLDFVLDHEEKSSKVWNKYKTNTILNGIISTTK